MLIICYLLLVNILSFAIYGADKLCAVKEKTRVAERSLIFLAAIGGAFGAYCAMKVFHHKTQKKKFTVTVPVLCGVYFAFIGLCLFQNYRLVTTEYEVVCPKLDKDAPEFCIVQISDLHNQFFGLHEQILLDRIADQKPDMIAVTGDVLDSAHTCYPFAREFLQGAVKIAPTYFITGNHEKWLMDKDSKYEEFIHDITDAGVILIDDTAVCFRGYMIAGIADNSLSKPVEELRDILSVNDDTLPYILLAHEPQYYDKYTDLGADIVLTGHVHGGQFIIPGRGGFISPEFQIFPELYSGEHIYKRDGGETAMIISRGLGNSGIPLRINNYPEIVVVRVSGK